MCEMRTFTKIESEVGEFYLVAQNKKLQAIHIGEEDFLRIEEVASLKEDPNDELLVECKRQLRQYFAGERTTFNLPIAQTGTKFQISVWNSLLEIPFGATKSYQEVANMIGRPKAVRAVGQANKANKFPIIVPCHRVIGKNQTLTGYAGSRVEIKDWLLKIEGAAFKHNGNKEN